MPLKKVTDEMLKGVVSRLGKAVRSRKLSKAKRIVDEWIDQLDNLPFSRHAVCLTALCAWAIDLYGPYVEQVKKAVLRFKQIPLGEPSLHDLTSLGVAEGLVKYHEEKHTDARTLFEQAKADADRIGDAELMTVTRYYLGRTQFKLTNYESAIELISDAKNRDLAAGNRVRAASMQLDEGWLHFLLGGVKEAQQRLDSAWEILAGQADAVIDQGNALSFKARLYREDGKYEAALDSCFAAIDVYGKYDPSYRNVARCRRNIAVIYRIKARDLLSREKISPDIRSGLTLQVEELRDKAFAELDQACEIYSFEPGRYHHGLGILNITRALLYFDTEELDNAWGEAEKAYEYGDKKGDNIVKAEAKVIQSGIALEGYKGIINAPQALKLANEAIHLGEQTERHRRLLARAYICKARALLESPHNDLSGARHCYEEAKTYLVPEDRDYLRASLDSLQKEIELKGHISSFSVQLTHNDIAGKPLTEITEKVEELILRYVYERCGKNIQRATDEQKTGARKVRNAVSIFKLTEGCFKKLASEGVDEAVLEKLACLKNREIQGRASFECLVKEKIGNDQTALLKLIRAHVSKIMPH